MAPAQPTITVERIDEMLAQLADIIESRSWGPKVWPLFERLEREREAMMGRRDRLAMARARLSGRTPTSIEDERVR